MEFWKGRGDGVVPRDLKEDVPGVVGADLKPARIVEGSGIDAADLGEALEAQIEFRAAGGAEVNGDQLAASFRAMPVDGCAAARDPQILQAKNRFDHIGRSRGALAEPAVADGDAKRLAQRLVSHATADAAALMHSHAALPDGQMQTDQHAAFGWASTISLSRPVQASLALRARRIAQPPKAAFVTRLPTPQPPPGAITGEHGSHPPPSGAPG